MTRFSARRAVFTVSKDANPEWRPEDVADNRIRYMTGQWERTDDEYVHFQGYAEFKNKMGSRRAIQDALGFKGYCEIANGSAEQCIEYVSKTDAEGKGNRMEGTEPFVMGVRACPAGSGSKRTDLDEIRGLLDSGSSIKDIQRAHFGTWCRNYKSFQLYKDGIDEDAVPDFRPVDVQVFWGESGASKSRRAMEKALQDHGSYYRPVINAQGQLWFNKYEGQKVLIIDDFYGAIKFSFMLRLLDGYKLEIERKGNTAWAQWDAIYLTSNTHPREWWSSYQSIPDESRLGFIRRITKIEHMLRKGALKRKAGEWVTQTEVTLEDDTFVETEEPAAKRWKAIGLFGYSSAGVS